MANKEKPKFIIQEKSWNTMQQYAQIAYEKDKNEISGLIPYKLVEHPVSKDMVYELFDPVILKQENTGTTTELDGEAIRDYQIKAGMKYGTDIKFCWWHSHHTMGAFWSGTDQNEINAWENDSWSLALVVNLFQEYKLNVSVWQPIQYSEDVSLEIIRPVPKITKKQLKEYEELCSNKVSAVATYSGWKKGNQVALWQQKTVDEYGINNLPPLKWKSGESLGLYTELIEYVDTTIDELIEKFCEGSADYKEYSTTIDSLNKALKERNAKISIVKLPQGEVLEKAMTMQAWEHVKYENDNIEKVYDEARVVQFNYGFGGHFA